MKAAVFAVENIPLIKKGDDIAHILSQRTQLIEYDIVVISSTVVSKSEGRVISLQNVIPSEKSKLIGKRNGNDPRFVQAVLDESIEILFESPFLLVCMKNGSICVNAGIDHSNVEGSDNALLLPKDPDKSALDLKRSLFNYTGKNVSVIITDTNGRAFRIGQTGAAIGCAGIKPTRDWRGTKDLFGRILEVKNEGIADEIAGFANILMGEGNGGMPIVIIRGLDLYDESHGIKELYRPPNEDEIRKAILKSRSI
ncbi:MAG TPA: coenzyme F420-0:L-glutamate ligase [Candidatus Limnocylindrales bacterium]|nr:coenzyme F420-0:L-glutamate ligase [Candidatus Limnocylindrales bacterium]